MGGGCKEGMGSSAKASWKAKHLPPQGDGTALFPSKEQPLLFSRGHGPSHLLGSILIQSRGKQGKRPQKIRDAVLLERRKQFWQTFPPTLCAAIGGGGGKARSRDLSFKLDYQEPHRGFCGEESQVPSEALIGCEVCVRYVCVKQETGRACPPRGCKSRDCLLRDGMPLWERWPDRWLWLTGNSSQGRPPSRSACAPPPILTQPHFHSASRQQPTPHNGLLDVQTVPPQC